MNLLQITLWIFFWILDPDTDTNNLTEKSSMATDSRVIMDLGEQTNPDQTFGKSMVLILDGKCESKEQSRLVDLLKALDCIESSHKTDFFFLKFFLDDCTTCLN